MKKFAKFVVLTFLGLTFLVLSTPQLAHAEDKDTPKPGVVQQFVKRVGAALNARAIIGSGTISAINSSSLVVTKNGMSYTVNFDGNTKFRRKFWGVSSLSEIQVGDIVNVIGKWTDDSHTAINAVQIRDLSIQKRFGVFFGTIISLTSNGWVMTTIQRGSQTVTVTSSTKFINRKQEVISVSDVKVGDRVRVKGLWDSKASTITEVTVVKDFSIPVVPSASPKAE